MKKLSGILVGVGAVASGLGMALMGATILGKEFKSEEPETVEPINVDTHDDSNEEF